MIFQNIYESDLRALFNARFIIMIVCSLLILFVLICLGVGITCLPNTQKSVMVQGIFRCNFLLLGSALAVNLFGEGNLGTMTMAQAVTIPLFNLLQVLCFVVFDNRDKSSGRQAIKKAGINILKNPLIIGSVFGILFSISGLTMPVIAAKTIDSMASLTTPLALICLGATFDVKKALVNSRLVIIATAIRLVVIPSIMVPLCYLLGFRGTELVTLFILFSGPTAVSSFVMAKNMGGDSDLAAQIVLSTSLFSVFTLFVGVYTLRAFALF